MSRHPGRFLLRRVALAILPVLLIAITALCAEYVFLTVPQWDAVKEHFDWGIPRISPVGDTLCVKPVTGEITPAMRNLLDSLQVDSTDYYPAESCRVRVLNWDGEGEP